MDVFVAIIVQLWRTPKWLWGLAFLPLLPLLFSVAQASRRRALARLGNVQLLGSCASDVSSKLRWGRVALTCGGMCLAFVAAARPQWGSATQFVRNEGLDIVVLFDTSLSMLAEDMKPNRLESAKSEIGMFIDRLRTDRVALVPYAGSAFVQCPLTHDHSALKMFLGDITPYTVPDEGTQIGTAIRTGLKAFSGTNDRNRVMILITDGEDHGSQPIEAAKSAAEKNVRIYTIGIGSPDGELIPDVGIDGRPDFLRDDQGSVVKTRLDENSLRMIAVETGGAYYRNSAAGTELDEILEDIAGLERSKQGEYQTVARIDRYQIPLGIAVFLFVLIPFVPERPRRRISQ